MQAISNINNNKESVEMLKENNKVKEVIEETVVEESVVKETEFNLEELMQEYDIPTFVSLARVVNCKPQYLYSRKYHKTGEYNYDSIARYLIKQYNENIAEIENVEIEDIVKLARVYLNDKKLGKIQRKMKNNIDPVVRAYNRYIEMFSELNDHEQELVKKMISENK